MRENCDVCGGLGAQVEVRPWNSAERVCEQGHRWFTSPVPGTGHGDHCPALCECRRYYASLEAV
jgi:hypothetical protein